MKMDEWYAVAPLEAGEKEAAIAAIVAEGLDNKQAYSWRCHQQVVPVKVLFFGVEDCIFLALLLAGLLFGLLMSLTTTYQLNLVPVVFFLSPLLYAALQGLTTWKEGMSGLAGWKQTCRISLQMLTALRMLYFGAGAVMASVPLNGCLWYLSGQWLSWWWMMGLSFASLFFYAALSLVCERHLWLPPLGWLLLSLAAGYSDGIQAFLLTIPAWAFFILALAGSIFCWQRWRKRFFYPLEGGRIYVEC